MISNCARRGLLAALVVIAAGLLGAALPLAASAFLPDGRIYEQVSPPNKQGNFVFPRGCVPLCFGTNFRGIAEANGNGVVWVSSGSVQGTSSSGDIQDVVSRRTPGQGWSSSSLLSSQLGFFTLFSTDLPYTILTPDFTKVAWESGFPYSPEETNEPYESINMFLSANPLQAPIWLGRPESPHAFPQPGYVNSPNDGTGIPYVLAGMTRDGSTVFFSYSGTLLEQDEMPFEQGSKGELIPGKESRRAHVGLGVSRRTPPIAYGFYEWHDGKLGEAGELPDGKLPTYGAVPAAFAGVNYVGNFSGENADGEVSEDGTRAYFVSPDPYSEAGGGPNCPGCNEPPQLYVREVLPNGERKTVLVSHSELESEPDKPSPTGVYRFSNAPSIRYAIGGSYVYGSTDGSHAYFTSTSRLTEDTPKITKVTIGLPWNTNGGTFTITAKGEGAEDTTTPIAYNASAQEVKLALEALSDVGSGNVTVTGGPVEYSAGKAGSYQVTINGKALAITTDGSKLAIETGIYVGVESPAYWYDFDTATGKVQYMAGLEGAYTEYSREGVTPMALARDGSRAMFLSVSGGVEKLIVWTNNSQGGSVEDAVKLPANQGNYWEGRVAPARASNDGNVYMFESAMSFPQFNDGGGHLQIFRYEASTKEFTCASCPPPGVNPTGDAETPLGEGPHGTQASRIMSADGSRIFFDSPDALVGSDTNGIRDVYEWENGHVYLITAGTTTHEESHYLDNSESGGDVFFTTEAGLVPGDKDQAGDVYDARIPQPGDNPAPNAVPCEGDVCQGPPAVPQLLTPAASAVFNGLGNIPPEPASAPPPPAKCKKGFALKNGKCVRKRTKVQHARHKHTKRHKKNKRRGK